jgi:hypothetical protein
MKIRCLAVAVAVLAAWLAAPQALADGGQILMHQTSEAFTVTVYASPEPLSTGPADFSVMVQDPTSQQIILDADVSLLLAPPQGPPTSIPLNHSSLAAPIMQSTPFLFDQPGRWALTVTVQRGTNKAAATAEFTVARSHSRQAVVWVFVLLPPLLIVLFAIQQSLKRRGPTRP